MTRNSTKSGRLNFGGVKILLADPNPYYRRILHSMLRNFGAKNIQEADTFEAASAILNTGHLDLVLCDYGISDRSGLTLVRQIRANRKSRNREIPILVMVGDPKIEIVEAARDAGANMVIGKPISPGGLFDRLLWVALVQRQFCETETFYGPDRRFKFEGFIAGAGRRKTDVDLNEIDAFFSEAKSDVPQEYAA